MNTKQFHFINILLTSILVILFCIVSFLLFKNNSPDSFNGDFTALEAELAAYQAAVDSFYTLDTTEVNEKIDNNDFFILYIGRKTCQWCRKVAPPLKNISLENKLDIFYLDSENSDNDIKLKNFRNKYEIETVPAIILFSGDSYLHIEYDIYSKNLKEELKKGILSSLDENIMKP